MVFVFQVVYKVDLHMLNPLWISRNKPTQIWWAIILCALGSICKYVVENLCIYIYSEGKLVHNFLSLDFLWFGYQC